MNRTVGQTPKAASGQSANQLTLPQKARATGHTHWPRLRGTARIDGQGYAQGSANREECDAHNQDGDLEEPRGAAVLAQKEIFTSS